MVLWFPSNYRYSKWHERTSYIRLISKAVRRNIAANVERPIYVLVNNLALEIILLAFLIWRYISLLAHHEYTKVTFVNIVKRHIDITLLTQNDTKKD